MCFYNTNGASSLQSLVVKTNEAAKMVESMQFLETGKDLVIKDIKEIRMEQIMGQDDILGRSR